ncbi:MAG: ATP-binding protein [Anaerolineales bacterium]|jgi:anti-sigma regulatory factor (Ser/Thr protein kinase)
MAGRTLTIQAFLDQIQKIRDLVSLAASDAGFKDDENYAVQLAVSEACENIILHGYGQENEAPIEVAVQTAPGEIQITLWDQAPPFNPAKGPKQPDWPPDDPPIGGLGLIIIHRVMDDIQYSREGDHNQLSMRKRSTAFRT